MMSMPLLWQTLLLMTIAYLVGAALACFLRRTFFAARLPTLSPVAAQTATSARIAVADPQPIAAPPPSMPAPSIVTPLPGSTRGVAAPPTTVPTPSVPVSRPAVPSAGLAARTGEPFRRADRDAPEPTPGFKPTTPVPMPPAASPRPDATPAPRAPTTPTTTKADRFGQALSGPGEATTSAKPPRAELHGGAAAAASAAAAAAAASLAPVRPVVVVPAGSRPILPTAGAPSDDLKRIRAIDAPLEAHLNSLGVTRFDQIAAWQAADVGRFSQQFGFRGRIEHENWIEQAQILSRGQETFYSRRRAKAEPVGAPSTGTVASTGSDAERSIDTATVQAARKAAELAAAMTRSAAADTRTQRVATPPSATPVPASSGRLEGQFSSGTAAALAAAAAAASTAAAAVIVPAPVPVVTSAPPTQPHVSERAAFATARPRLAADASAAQSLLRSATSASPLAGSTRDHLQRIAGINAEIEKLLNVQGVARFNQIANWSRTDVERFDRLLGHPGRIARENWIEQAQILSKGSDTAYSRDFDRRHGDVPAAPLRPGPTLAEASPSTRPARLADAIQHNTRPASEPERVVAATPRTGDLSSLRSVRSEAYRGSEGALVGPTITAAAGPTPASGDTLRIVRSTTPDDLKRIRGVGVLIEKKLISMGIARYEQIANWTTADIERVSQALDFKGRIERENWVEQARILGSGGQTEFSRRVDRGEVDSSRGRP